ncbi:lipid-A-disaccharide synthase [Ideonella azotifigens]|uniref:Lipid-A-disaccharide synthase n=2 Tax=Ideonella azotifigens TaxID=513160 RepID=A0ABP3VAX1_9BURK|nr:lipid-A-disaccharide synthase [Ideonella azotifigens]MCD2343946.1 lipid-A-disaccharide synthase [Ideonella azotifigens]
MTNPAPRLAMVAGEASGDLLASLLLKGLHARWPGTQATGIGGPRMIAEGFSAWWPSAKLSVFGYVDALMHLRELLRIRSQLRERLLVERPDVFIGVDAPDFNFGLETALRAGGLRTVHFVCPSIWAWRGERVKKLAAAADHVLCLFPFEPALLAEHGVAATFVGHPLADLIPLAPPREAARQALGLGAGDTIVALLPGSRRSEIRHIAPALLQAAVQMAAAWPVQRGPLRFVVPVAPGLRPLLLPLLAQHAPGLAVDLVDGRSHEVLAACDVTLLASGTATLEAALFKRPMVIVYRLHWLNYRMMRGKAYLPWHGLPNILAREFLVPELIQDQATPQAIAREALAWLDNPDRCAQLAQRFETMHLTLRQDTARKASDAIATLLQA